jgi:hypothetical protein
MVLWRKILALNPPPMLFSAYRTLFRFFAFRDPTFLPQYMHRVYEDQSEKRVGDDIWLASVLRPIFTVLDFVSNPLPQGILDLWEDVLVLNPPINFLLENWRIILKLTHFDLRFIEKYVEMISRLLKNAPSGDQDWFGLAISPAIGALIEVGNQQPEKQEMIWNQILAMDIPCDQLPADIAKAVEARLSVGEDI